jgi:hypothetical protein
MGNLLGQTPWAMMNQLTERNLELWQEFQRNFGAGFGRPGGPGTPPTPPGASGMGSGPMGTGTHGTAGSAGKARNRG